MSMGIVNDADFNAEMERLNPQPLQEVEHTEIQRGRGHNNAVPDSLRKVIAEEAIEGTPSKDIQEAFGISPASVSAYKNGATSTASYNNPIQDLKEHNNKVRNLILSKARNKLVKALDSITESKMDDASLRDITGVATAMATVMEKVQPKNEAHLNIDKLMIYAPRMKEEDSYDVITVNE